MFNECAIASSIGLLDGKYKVNIVHHIKNNKVLTFSKLRELMPQAREEALKAELVKLQEENIILAENISGDHNATEYSLSAYAENMAPVLDVLLKWSQQDDDTCS